MCGKPHEAHLDRQSRLSTLIRLKSDNANLRSVRLGKVLRVSFTFVEPPHMVYGNYLLANNDANN